MRHFTVLAVIEVPDDYDVEDDGDAGYETALRYAHSALFAVVEEGVTPAAFVAGADPTSWPTST